MNIIGKKNCPYCHVKPGNKIGSMHKGAGRIKTCAACGNTYKTSDTRAGIALIVFFAVVFAPTVIGLFNAELFGFSVLYMKYPLAILLFYLILGNTKVEPEGHRLAQFKRTLPLRVREC